MKNVELKIKKNAAKPRRGATLITPYKCSVSGTQCGVAECRMKNEKLKKMPLSPAGAQH